MYVLLSLQLFSTTEIIRCVSDYLIPNLAASDFPNAGKVTLLKHWAVEDWVVLCSVTGWETSAGTRQMRNGGKTKMLCPI